MALMAAIVSVPDREILSTRVFFVTRARMFQAWTDPAILAQWWGPKGFTNTFHEFDLRPGGHWRFVMHGPNGADYRNESRFIGIIPMECIEFEHVSPPQFHTTVLLTDEAGGTRVRWQMLFPTVEDYERVKGVAVQGNEENLDRLEAWLATRP